jgi:myo-inositol 2-dehydrogenase/D-chiro-inositol 1-dehydrogenase
MNASPPIRVGLIGCGDIAETGHVPALLAHHRFELAAVCDKRRERAALLSKMAGGVPMYRDYRALLRNIDVDAVILALHPEVSVDIAIDCLRRGKAVLDEKPLANSTAEGLRLARQVANSPNTYQLGFVFRYSRLVQEVKRLAKSVGGPAVYRVRIVDETLDRTNLEHFERIQRILNCSSAITHEGSHVIDYVSHWTGATPVRVSAHALKTESDFAGPNLWNAQIAFSDGSVLILEIAWFLREQVPCDLFVTGPRGSFAVDLRTGVGHRSVAAERSPLHLSPLSQDWREQLDIFADAIDGRGLQGASVQDGLRVLTATKACEESASTGKSVLLMPASHQPRVAVAAT